MFGVQLLVFLPYYIIGVVTERNGVERGHRGRFAFVGSATFEGAETGTSSLRSLSFASLLSKTYLYIDDGGISTLDNIFLGM